MLTDYAQQYFKNTFGDKDAVLDDLRSRAVDGYLNIDDINSMYHTVQDWTGSGSQGYGRKDLQELYYDENGNPILTYRDKDKLQNLFRNGADDYSSATGFVTGDKLGDISIRGFGEDLNYYQPTEGGMTYEGARSYKDLTPEEIQRLQSEGLFDSSDPRAQFITTDPSHSKKYYGDLDLSSGKISVDDLERVVGGSLRRQYDAMGNTAQKEAGGIGDFMPTIMSLAGSALGIPALSLFGKVGSVGQSLASGNYAGALMGGLGAYNTAAGIGNAAAGANMYSQFNPAGYIGRQLGLNGNYANAAGGAIMGGGLGALTGQDPMRGALMGGLNSLTPDVLRQYGINNPMINQAASGTINNTLTGRKTDPRRIAMGMLNNMWR